MIRFVDIEIVVILSRNFVAYSSNLFDDRIFSHCVSCSTSSSGVQITGAFNPLASQIEAGWRGTRRCHTAH